jgi:hypothetical protein
VVEELARAAAERLVAAMGTGEWLSVRDRIAGVIGLGARLDAANARATAASGAQREGRAADETAAWYTRVHDLLEERPELAAPLREALRTVDDRRATEARRPLRHPDVTAHATVEGHDTVRVRAKGDVRVDNRRSIRQLTVNVAKGHPIITIAVLVALVGGGGVAAKLASGGGETARITLSPSVVEQGGTYEISGGGFAGGESVRFSWDDDMHVIGETVADKNGKLTGFTVHEGEDSATRSYVIIGSGLRSGRHGSATLTVVQPVAHVVAEKSGNWSGGRNGLTLTVTHVARASNRNVRVSFTVYNRNADTVSLSLMDLTASTGSTNLAVVADDAGTSWPGNVGGNGQASGTVVLATVAGPATLSMSFPHGILVPGHFYELAVHDVPIP